MRLISPLVAMVTTWLTAWVQPRIVDWRIISTNDATLQQHASACLIRLDDDKHEFRVDPLPLVRGHFRVTSDGKRVHMSLWGFMPSKTYRVMPNKDLNLMHLTTIDNSTYYVLRRITPPPATGPCLF